MATLRACYDLTRGPPQYEIVWFLVYLEARRIGGRDQCEDISLVLAPLSLVKRTAIFNAVVVPMCWMLRSVAKVELLDDLPDEEMFGKGTRYTGMAEVMKPGLEIAGRCLRPHLTFPRNNKLVTITLREASYETERNSDVDEWLKAAAAIVNAGYEVVFVRDTAKAEQTLDPFPINPAASVDLEHRGALYRSAFCNLFVSNGPAGFAMAIDAPVLMLKPTCDKLGWSFSEAMYVHYKIKNLPGNPKHQRMVFEEDTSSNIIRAFNEWTTQQSLNPG
jgi:hypothetical protein